MRINEDLTIRGQRCVLVPYRREHVETYHRWMQDPHLQQTTESEPLTMEQEYDMQRSWREDEDKCTFIVLDPTLPGGPPEPPPAVGEAQPLEPEQRSVQLMSGDVNLYFNDPDDRAVAEIEVMVAEPRSRRKGIAREALQLMMAFAVARLGVTRFRCDGLLVVMSGALARNQAAVRRGTHTVPPRWRCCAPPRAHAGPRSWRTTRRRWRCSSSCSTRRQSAWPCSTRCTWSWTWRPARRRTRSSRRCG